MINKEFWANKRVLITGDTGFKGSWLLTWMQQLNCQVWGYSKDHEDEGELYKEISIGLDKWKHNHNCGNLSELERLKELIEEVQPEIVIHLAAQALVRKSYKDPLDTWNTNVIGSLNLLEALKRVRNECSVVMVTTDKVYENKEWDYGYRENDKLGGDDPYSASKAATELAIASWRKSFCGKKTNQTNKLHIATARAGNVVGGGDWGIDRIVPDAARAIAQKKPIMIRNGTATRPWQHVLEPLYGYLLLAEKLTLMKNKEDLAFNFGPMLDNNRSVDELILEIGKHQELEAKYSYDPNAPKEATKLKLQIDKAVEELGWKPQWNFSKTIETTMNWYKKRALGVAAIECCHSDIELYEKYLRQAEKSHE